MKHSQIRQVTRHLSSLPFTIVSSLPCNAPSHPLRHPQSRRSSFLRQCQSQTWLAQSSGLGLKKTVFRLRWQTLQLPQETSSEFCSQKFPEDICLQRAQDHFSGSVEVFLLSLMFSFFMKLLYWERKMFFFFFCNSAYSSLTLIYPNGKELILCLSEFHCSHRKKQQHNKYLCSSDSRQMKVTPSPCDVCGSKIQPHRINTIFTNILLCIWPLLFGHLSSLLLK